MIFGALATKSRHAPKKRLELLGPACAFSSESYSIP